MGCYVLLVEVLKGRYELKIPAGAAKYWVTGELDVVVELEGVSGDNHCVEIAKALVDDHSKRGIELLVEPYRLKGCQQIRHFTEAVIKAYTFVKPVQLTFPDNIAADIASAGRALEVHVLQALQGWLPPYYPIMCKFQLSSLEEVHEVCDGLASMKGVARTSTAIVLTPA